jgi:large subunit ribosomal protein L24
MTSRVAMTGGVIRLDDIDAKLGASIIRGRLTIDNGSPRRIDGTVETDGADAAEFVAFAVGLPSQAAAPGSAWNWSGEPFGAGVFGGLTGQVALKLKNAELLPRLVAGDLNATMRFGKDGIGLVDATGHLAGGQLSGQVMLRTAEDGLTMQTKIDVTGAKAPQLLAALARAPVSGSVDFSAEAEGTGLSAVALIGSLKGGGKFAFTDTQIAGLDAHVFDAVTQAADHGVPIERGRISDLVNRSLENGPLILKHADASFRVAAGQIRIDTVTVDSKDAAVTAAGTLDLTDGSLDARIVLTGRSEAAGARPDITVALKGPLSAPSRDVDVSALVSWLTLRAVENQATRLHAIEAPTRTVPASKGRQAPALPAPIDIRPAPAPRNAGRPAASVGPQR